MKIIIQCNPKCKGCFEHLLSPLNKQELIRNILNISGDVKPCPFASVTDSQIVGVTVKNEHGSLFLNKMSRL